MSSRVDLSYNSVWLSYQPLCSLLKLFGVYPAKWRSSKCGYICLVMLNIILAIVTLTISAKFDFFDSAITLDETTTITILWAISLGALITIISVPFKTSTRLQLFDKWRMLDKRLGIAVDNYTSLWARRLLLIFIGMVILFTATSTTIVFSQRVTEEPLVNLILSFEVLLLTWNYSTILLVQLCVMFFCLALKFRFQQLKNLAKQMLQSPETIAPNLQVKSVHVFTLTNDVIDISGEIEELRHSYHMLTDMTVDVSGLFSPHILLSFLLDSAILCTSMYRVIKKLSDLTAWYIPLEILTMVVAILKILAINVVGDEISKSANETLRVFPKTCYQFKSKESKNQAQLLTLTTQCADGPAITATGFFTLDRRMFTATLGTVATYFVVLLQFQQ
ncbi:hypothetical protein CHUAL_011297 [Chamberlinius hualienensis]